jgi:rhodanese-related sulfurtransferase
MPALLSPEEAHARLGAEPELTYVDVRAVGEFVQGRPLGRVINIPVAFLHPVSGAQVPNADFVHIVKTLLGEVPAVLVGGGTDERQAGAAALLEAAGVPGVAVVEGGLEAWRAALLPTTRDNREGVSYVSLLLKVRRGDKAAKKSHAAH